VKVSSTQFTFRKVILAIIALGNILLPTLQCKAADAVENLSQQPNSIHQRVQPFAKNKEVITSESEELTKADSFTIDEIDKRYRKSSFIGFERDHICLYESAGFGVLCLGYYIMNYMINGDSSIANPLFL